MKDFDKIILGIDPGTNILGYGLIGITNKKMTLVSTGIVRMSKLENHQMKLKKIFHKVLKLIQVAKIFLELKLVQKMGKLIISKPVNLIKPLPTKSLKVQMQNTIIKIELQKKILQA